MEGLDQEKSIATVRILPNEIIELTYGGNISADTHREILVNTVEEVKKGIMEMKEKNGVARIITDVSELKNFDDEAVGIVKGLAAWPGASDVKTAVIGGNLVSKMVLRMLIAMTGRKNLRAFDTREEAYAWLLSDVP